MAKRYENGARVKVTWIKVLMPAAIGALIAFGGWIVSSVFANEGHAKLADEKFEIHEEQISDMRSKQRELQQAVYEIGGDVREINVHLRSMDEMKQDLRELRESMGR